MSDECRGDGMRVPIKGRGAVDNPAGRFDHLTKQPEDDGWYRAAEGVPSIQTSVEVDHARRVIAYNDSPDVPFDRSINPYRGCEHGCSYCFARPSHAYLGLSPGLDFESRLFYKPDAAEKLRRELSAPGYACAPIALGVNTDAYQPIEKRFQLTRALLEVLLEARHPVYLITKSALIERDLDILQQMAEASLVGVAVSLTTLDADLERRLEPRAAGGKRRLRVIETLAKHGIPVSVSVAPVIPVLTDPELERLLEAARAHGAQAAGFVMLRLPHELQGLFASWLETHYPLKAAHVLNTLRQMHGGALYRSQFGRRGRGDGAYADVVAQRFRMACRRLGLSEHTAALDCGQFRPPTPAGGQLALFS